MRFIACIVILLMGWGVALADSPRVVLTGDLAAWRDPRGTWATVADVGIDQSNAKQLTWKPGTEAIANSKSTHTTNLITKQEFGDCQIHVEFLIAKGSNSGVYLMGRYELQIYDSFGKDKDEYPGIECGGIYPRWIDNHGVDGHSPRVNASKPAGQWQTFDITFRAPRFDGNGKKISDAVYEKVLHNGVVVHENIELPGPTRSATFDDEKPTGPLMLQGDHGPVAFRNITVTPLSDSAK